MRYNKVMFIVGLLKWWYSAGWSRQAQIIADGLHRTTDYFSIGLLLRTMFSLFRQDGAGSVDGPLTVKLEAFAGALISRFIGAGIRTAVVLMGCVTIVLRVLFGGVMLLLWLFVPFLPIIGFIVMMTGWIPWQF